MLYTRFERARILGARALQIAMGAPPVLDLAPERADPLILACAEFDASSIPLTVTRFGHAVG